MATAPISRPSGLGNLRAVVRTCSYCGSDEIYRQRPRGLIERHFFQAFQFAPFWCAACDRRFYLRVRNSANRQA